MRTAISSLFAATALLAAAPHALSAQGYGSSTAASGEDLFVGESLNERGPGYVFVYRRSDGTWAEVQRLQASDAAAGDHFGRALATSGDDLLVGATVVDGTRGAVYVFRRGSDGMWSQTDRISASDGAEGDAFGRALAVAGDVALAASWAHGEARGAVYALTRDETGRWSEEAKLTAGEGQPEEWFGFSLATDGRIALVGARGREGEAGEVHAFRRSASGEWTDAGTIAMEEADANAQFGSAVALHGGLALVGAPGANGRTGAVYGYALDEDSGEWTQRGVLQPFEVGYADFGRSIVPSPQGGDLWIGAPLAGGFEGRAFFASWDEDSQSWGAMTKVSVEGLAQGDGLGGAIAAGDDVVVAGLAGDDFGAGTAAILARSPGGDWTAEATVASEIAGLDAVTGGDVACEEGAASVFTCSDVDLVSFLPVQRLGGGRGVKVNDVWGWTDPVTGTEWALVGRYDGTAFVDLSDPGNPIYAGELPLTEGARPNVWRDVKVYENHAFIVADGAGEHGMQVFDLTRLRDVADPPRTFEATAHYDRIHSAHNIVLNEETGFAYAVGASGGGDTCGGGLHMIDVREPAEPTFAGCFADAATGRQRTGYSHDAMCIVYHGPDEEHRGKEICFGSNETALSIADVTDKDAPVALAMEEYPNAQYSHQGWIDPEHEYFYMNDELDELGGAVANTRTLIWDVKDLDEPLLVNEHLSENRSSDHNLYILDDVMFQSNYVSGLRVLDISDRLNPEEIGYFDTVPWGEDEPGFDGSWSNYPYFASGIVVVTSGAEGVFVLRQARRDLVP